MEIILLQKVANLGQIGDRVKVKSGYARNYLVPTGRATLATAANIAKFEAQRVELEAKAGQPVSRSEVRMPTGPIRVTGEHQVQLHLHTDVDAALTVTIVAEE